MQIFIESLNNQQTHFSRALFLASSAAVGGVRTDSSFVHAPCASLSSYASSATLLKQEQSHIRDVSNAIYQQCDSTYG